MRLKQLLANSALVAGVGVAAIGLGGGLASAEPYPPPPTGSDRSAATAGP